MRESDKIMEVKKNKFFKRPKILFLIFMNTKIWNFIPDKIFLKIKYLIIFGKKINLNKPRTFNEKIQWLKIYNKKDIYVTMVDKYLVKGYVEKIIGKENIIPTIDKYDDFDDIDFAKLPRQFVIKCTHDSGGLVICKDKKNLNICAAKSKISKSLKKNYFYLGREWPYKNIKPRIIVEKYMGDNLNDYKIFCFNGEPKFTLVCSNRNGNSKNTDFYDNNWNLLPFTRACHVNNPNGIDKPKNFNKMLEIAKKLSANIPFLRVDLYVINGKIYFGELTFYPSSGFESFTPEEWDEKLGDMLDLSMVKKK